MIITFCGHRDIIISLEEIELIKRFLIEKIETYPNTKFYLGGYGNFDNIVYAILKDLKNVFPSIELIFISPYLNPNYTKLQNAKEFYDDVIYPPLEKVPKKFAILERNKWIVDKCDLIVSYVKYPWGGASKMLDYAIKKHKPYINFYK